jgi:guanine deaminase
MAIHFGNIITTRTSGDFDLLLNSALCERNGRIVFIGNKEEAKAKYINDTIYDHNGSIMLPGLIDLHTHLPQYRAIGLGKGTLLEWLEGYIFPEEEKFKDKKYTKALAKKFFRELLEHGTTTAVIFGPAQRDATDIAFQEAEKAGIRLFMGKTMMDIGITKLTSSTNQNISDSLSLAEKWHRKNDGLLNYIILPRYAGSCSYELMRNAADIAKANGLMIQTHIAENKEEIKYIANLYPEFDSYLNIYEKAGIIGENAQFVHCIYLSDREIEILNQSGSSIIHCPVSNRYLQSGIMPLNDHLQKGIPVGLGTDIAGGYSFSVLNEAREAIESTKSYNIAHNARNSPITAEKSLKMATIEAAKILGISMETGSLEVGKSADMLVLDVQNIIDDLSKENTSSIISKIIYRFQDTQIKKVYVRGKTLFSPLS